MRNIENMTRGKGLIKLVVKSITRSINKTWIKRGMKDEWRNKNQYPGKAEFFTISN